MPTYVYRREDGTTFEVSQRITEDALQTCPTTGQPVTRIISGSAGLIFKGSGFYLTDYARKGNGASNGTSDTNGTSTSNGSTPSTNGTGSAKTETTTGSFSKG